jgi:hypothetical protein
MVSSPAVARSATGQFALPGHHQRQRPRPERGRQLTTDGSKLSQVGCGLDIPHVHDQRIELRPALGREDRRNGAPIGGVGAKAVHSLGGKRDELAAPQRLGGGLNRVIAALTTAIAVDPAVAPFRAAPFRPSLPLTSRVETATRCEAAMTYQAPVDDIIHALKTAAGLDELIGQGLLGGVDEDTIRAVIEEAGKFASRCSSR